MNSAVPACTKSVAFQPMPHRQVEGDQDGDAVAQGVVVEGADRLGKEQRQEAPALQQGELVARSLMSLGNLAERGDDSDVFRNMSDLRRIIKA